MQNRPNLRRSLLALSAFALACATQDGPFTSSGNPTLPLYQARTECKAKYSTTEADGAIEVDWSRYERCMADYGWIKQATPSTGGSPTAGGSRPGY
jgi:hypothetical protein